MGNLTDDMTRLRGEVNALRDARGALMQDLAGGARDLATAVAVMRADFMSAHAAMIKETRGNRVAFLSSLISEVNSLLGTFSRNRDNMARNGRHDREVFLSELRRQVKGLCKDTADDLMGARLAWCGRSPVKSRPVPTKKEPVVVKPMTPPVEGEPKKTVAAPEIKAEKSPAAFKEPAAVKPMAPPVEGEPKKTAAAPEIKAEKSPAALKEPLKKKKEEKKQTVVAVPDKKSAEAPTKSKRGRKYNTRSS